MVSINLLPKKFQSKDTYFKLSKNLRILNMLVTIAFFVSVAVIIGIVIVNQTRIGNLERQNEAFKTSIKSMNQIESSYTLLKGRAQLFSVIKEDRGAEGVFTNFEKAFITDNPIVFDRADIDKTKSSVSIRATDASTLSNFLEKLIALKLYRKVVISAFSFRPADGYFIDLELN